MVKVINSYFITAAEACNNQPQKYCSLGLNAQLIFWNPHQETKEWNHSKKKQGKSYCFLYSLISVLVYQNYKYFNQTPCWSSLADSPNCSSISVDSNRINCRGQPCGSDQKSFYSSMSLQKWPGVDAQETPHREDKKEVVLSLRYSQCVASLCMRDGFVLSNIPH